MITRWIISSLLMIGLAFASFGHHTVAPDKQAQAAAYVLAGGDWADICGDGTDPLAGSATCLACVISQGCALPPHTAAPDLKTQSIAAAWSLYDQTGPSIGHLHSHAARAPPFI